MRRPSVLMLGIPLLLLITVTPTIAVYRFWNVSQTASSSTEACLACSRSPTTLMAWNEGPGEIWSRAIVGGALQAPHDHGPGLLPTLGWGIAGVVLAYASGTDVVIVEGNGNSWATPLVFHDGETVTSLDVWCSPAAASDDAYLVWETDGQKVRFARRTSTGWSTPETLFQGSAPLEWLRPRVRPTTAGEGIVPRVYFFNQVKLRYVQYNGASWNAPVMVTGLQTAGTDLAVAVGPDLRHHVLALTPQPS